MLLIGLAWGFPTLGLDTSTPGEGQLPLSGGSDGKSGAQLASIRKMSKQESRGSVGEYQADEQAGVARLSWRVSGR